MQNLHFALLTNLPLLKAMKDMSHDLRVKEKYRLQQTKNPQFSVPIAKQWIISAD